MAEGAARMARSERQATPGEIADAIATDGTFSRQGLDLLFRDEAFGPWQAACELLRKQLARED